MGHCGKVHKESKGGTKISNEVPAAPVDRERATKKRRIENETRKILIKFML